VVVVEVVGLTLMSECGFACRRVQLVDSAPVEQRARKKYHDHEKLYFVE
jgi:hypothetical protein